MKLFPIIEKYTENTLLNIFKIPKFKLKRKIQEKHQKINHIDIIYKRYNV